MTVIHSQKRPQIVRPIGVAIAERRRCVCRNSAINIVRSRGTHRRGAS